MPNPNQTIPPVNRRSGMWASMRDHAKSKNGGWRGWVGAIAGGAAIAGFGVGLTLLIEETPWWVAAICVAAGLQIGSRGAFIAALGPLKGGIIDIMRAKKE